MFGMTYQFFHCFKITSLVRNKNIKISKHNKNYTLIFASKSTLIFASKSRHTSIGIIFIVYWDEAIFGSL